jgi:chromosome segregation ATPase
MTSADPLVAIADRLYAVPADAFTEARNAAAREAGDDKELARRVKALRKPSTSAWAVNLLVRREAGQIDQVLTLGASLREAAASMQGEELRALTRQRRQLTTALASSARSLARESGVRLSQAVVDQVEGVLNAAMLDRVAADAVRSGLLVKAFTSTGVSELDVESVVAVPAALGTVPTPVERPRPDLRVVPEDDAVRRARARDAVDQAAAEVDRVQADVDEAARQVADLEARRLQVHEEIDELRRRLADLETAADQVEEDLDEAVEGRDEAGRRLAEARAAHERAVQALEKLEE